MESARGLPADFLGVPRFEGERKVRAHACLAGGVRTTIAKHHGRYSKPDHLCQDGVE